MWLQHLFVNNELGVHFDSSANSAWMLLVSRKSNYIYIFKNLGFCLPLDKKIILLSLKTLNPLSLYVHVIGRILIVSIITLFKMEMKEKVPPSYSYYIQIG